MTSCRLLSCFSSLRFILTSIFLLHQTACFVALFIILVCLHVFKCSLLLYHFVIADACRSELRLRLEAARSAKEISAGQDEKRNEEKKKKKKKEEKEKKQNKKQHEGQHDDARRGESLELGPAASTAALLSRCRALCSNATAPLSLSSTRLARLSRSAGGLVERRDTYIHTYIRTYIHTYIRTYIHTYIHTYM